MSSEMMSAREPIGAILAECDKLSSEINARLDNIQQVIEPRPSGTEAKLQPSTQSIAGVLREMRRKLRFSLEKINQLQEEFGTPR